MLMPRFQRENEADGNESYVVEKMYKHKSETGNGMSQRLLMRTDCCCLVVDAVILSGTLQ